MITKLGSEFTKNAGILKGLSVLGKVTSGIGNVLDIIPAIKENIDRVDPLTEDNKLKED